MSRSGRLLLVPVVISVPVHSCLYLLLVVRPTVRSTRLWARAKKDRNSKSLYTDTTGIRSLDSQISAGNPRFDQWWLVAVSPAPETTMPVPGFCSVGDFAHMCVLICPPSDRVEGPCMDKLGFTDPFFRHSLLWRDWPRPNAHMSPVPRRNQMGLVR
ncbi:hypothetical protein CI102_2327 [Trichoderma harzianum]|uniref:Uncharacterized protein n=1 Tax=Trichoderma harzianum CBS 226.95 TaxID=983964 RepID=A0A2T4A3J4_TRIHA|nr:hypothetical protein M431DRAFT_224348 [Trichoderma harzianum CBS 226.95]PKK51946.1 hypothetical protein CI102_2327 [Trichoderma harzianum]PTB51642.1 hypothetical protein M431DRAFT_224348 [Trichoderma harzianum CBS 226.95]